MATDPRVETLRELRQINATLTAIAGTLLDMADKFNGHTVKPAVNDSACNGPHGDPIIKAKDPRDWSGPPMNGKHFSECPPEYLDLMASRYDYFATKDEDATKQRYAKLDASRARAWAARLRSGWTPAPSAPEVQEHEVNW
jgi:hypothetical protein